MSPCAVIFQAFALFFILHFSFFIPSAAAQRPQQRPQQRPTTIAFWNTENLFDTIPSPFYDDAEYTPRGSRRWNTVRYTTKIANLASVIDEMSADIIGLAEVENETVVRDLVRALRTDYNYIHRTSGDSRGIDVALLYKGDRFFPDADSAGNLTGVRMVRSGTGREFLHVTGELAGGQPDTRQGELEQPAGEPETDRIELIVCHLASNLNSDAYRRRNMTALRSLLETRLAENPAAKIVVMGDMNATPGDRMVRRILGDVSSPLNFMFTPHYPLHRQGWGSYSYRGRWYLYDWIMLSPALAGRIGRAGSGGSGGSEDRAYKADRADRTGSGSRAVRGWIYARERMSEPDASSMEWVRRPLGTFRGGDWLGGYSDHFPVGISIVK